VATMDDAVRVQRGVVWEEFDAQVLAVTPGARAVYVLNRTASEIWRGVCAGLPLAAIARQLADACQQDPRAASRVVAAFMVRLSEAGLVVCGGQVAITPDQAGLVCWMAEEPEATEQPGPRRGRPKRLRPMGGSVPF